MIEILQRYYETGTCINELSRTGYCKVLGQSKSKLSGYFEIRM